MFCALGCFGFYFWNKHKQRVKRQATRTATTTTDNKKKTPQEMARKTSFVVLEHVRDRSKFALYGAVAAVSAAAATPCKIQDTLSVFVSERNKIQQLML